MDDKDSCTQNSWTKVLSDFASPLKDKEDPRRLNQNIVISLTDATAQRDLYASQNVL